MPFLRVIAAFALAALVVSAASAQERFFSKVEDMPLMPGLSERPNATVVFEKPEGRIVELTAQGRADRARTIAFYDRVLPELGWVRQPDGSFRREAERLRLAVAERSGNVTLRITITPE